MNTQLSVYKILLVEDDKNISEYLKSSLEAQKHSVHAINDGAEAVKFLEKLDSNSFDIVLLDLNLPGANGWVILAKIRSTSAIAEYPVIILTGMDDDATEGQALYDGADDFISNPCSMNILLARINAIIRNKTRKPTVGSGITYDIKDFDELTPREKEILFLYLAD